ncbi:hypothetical protein [Desulfobotulus sp.]|uniref:hypothetical protein n=1 Tax=Desulfobotulus sp. TaxID=1940337 RepID=UPI002A363380|nr:hypothetical protein [Desulfobotulus sp.]MDY0164639.1 hypothetical protein [Desulfobotulus sp.]
MKAAMAQPQADLTPITEDAATPHGPISGELHALGLEVKSLTERVGNKDLRKIIGIGNNLFALAERVAALEQMPLETL